MPASNLLVEAQKESAFSNFEFKNPEEWIELFKANHFFLEEPDKGFIAGLIGTNHLNMQGIPVAMEVAWYVRPEHRKSKVGYKLYKAFEDWARKQGAEYIICGKKLKGYKEVSRVYLKRI